jgi:hypothetical protein
LAAGDTVFFGDGSLTTQEDFTDLWTFDLTSEALITVSQATTLAAQDNQLIDDFTIELFQGAPTGTAVAGTFDEQVACFVGTSCQVSFSTSLSTLGEYYIEITGLLGSSPNAAYSGQLSLSNPPLVTTTPLPGALALFAGGLGLLGFAGLRKSRKTGRSLTRVATA